MLLPVPGKNPERLGELGVHVQEKVVPGRLPVRSITVVPSEQIVNEAEEFVTVGTGGKINMTVSVTAGHGELPVAVRTSFTYPVEISNGPGV